MRSVSLKFSTKNNDSTKHAQCAVRCHERASLAFGATDWRPNCRPRCASAQSWWIWGAAL